MFFHRINRGRGGGEREGLKVLFWENIQNSHGSSWPVLCYHLPRGNLHACTLKLCKLKLLLCILQSFTTLILHYYRYTLGLRVVRGIWSGYGFDSIRPISPRTFFAFIALASSRSCPPVRLSSVCSTARVSALRYIDTIDLVSSCFGFKDFR